LTIRFFYLVDSGGQYQDGGTTDVTRTFHYGQPTSEMIEMYTRVLMGHIDLARAIVPEGSTDREIDFATRQPLYKVGMTYG
jgi:Xaa-Pro aminopeptidase